MEKLPFDLTELVPQDAVFNVSGCDKPLTLGKWSLRVRAWAVKTYGAQRINEIFTRQEIDEIADIAWFMLKEKDLFQNNKDLFLDAISSVKDQINLVTALLGAVGIGEPEIDKIKKAAEEKDGGAPDPNAQSPKT